MPDTKSEAPPATKGKKGLVLMIAAALLVLGGGGGAAWYFLKPAPAGGTEQAQAHKKKARTYATLEPFTVNLADPGGERFVQLSIALEMADSAASNSVTSNIPAVRNAVLLLLSTKTSQDLLSVDGKTHLASEIATAVGAQIGWMPSEADKVETAATASAKPVSTGAPGNAAAPAKKPSASGAPNPVEGVHFVQFIVQ